VGSELNVRTWNGERQLSTRVLDVIRSDVHWAVCSNNLTHLGRENLNFGAIDFVSQCIDPTHLNPICGALEELCFESPVLAVGQGVQAMLLWVRRLAVVRVNRVGITPERTIAVTSGEVVMVVLFGCDLQELKTVYILLKVQVFERKRGGRDEGSPQHHG